MTKFRRQFDPDRPIRKIDGKWPKSVVRPDLGLTVRELMDRHTRFPDDLNVRDGNYTGDEEIPMDLDISEVKDMKDTLRRNEANLKKDLDRREREKRKKEQDEHIEREVQKRVSQVSKKQEDKPE